MKCQRLFSGKKKKKNISKCHLLKILPRLIKMFGLAKILFKLKTGICYIFEGP